MKHAFSVLPVLFIAMALSLRAEETITHGGAVVPVAKGWTQVQATQEDTVVLSPSDLDKGAVCTFTLLGGEAFSGSLQDRLNSEWKDFEKLGRMVSDTGGKVDGAGNPVQIAGRSGQIELQNGANVFVWLVISSANGRIERMVLVTTTGEVFQRYAKDVTAMINGTKYVVPKPPENIAGTTPGKFGKMIYTVPPGWREKRSEREVVISPNVLPAGESLEIVLMPPAEANGALTTSLQQAWDEGARQSHFTTTRTVNNTAYETREERTSFRGWPYIRAEGTMTSVAESRDYFAALTVIKINNRLERVLVRSRDNNYHYSRYSMCRVPKYDQAIEEFIFGLKFEDWKDPKVEPATLKGGGIVGAWAGISLFGGKLHTGYAIFFSNGQVFFSSRFPLRGCYEFDTWIDAERFPRYWGTYQFKDGRGVIKMIYGEIPVVSKENDLILTTNKTDHTYIRLPSVNGVHFNGTYGFPQPTGKNPSIVFTADGHFDDQGALSVLRIETGVPYSAVSEPGNGTYLVKDCTLILDYSDGRKYRIAFPGRPLYDPRDPSPDALPMGYGDQEMKKL